MRARSSPSGAPVPTAAVALLVVNAAIGAETTLTFRQDLNGYAASVDATLKQSAPMTSFGNTADVEWDGDDPSSSGQANYALVRFDDVFGPSPDQVPQGAAIVAATLAYHVFNSGAHGAVYESAVDWSESTTFNTFGATPGVQPEDRGAFVTSAMRELGVNAIDVTASLARWSADPAANRGWIILPTGTNGVQFRSSEYASVALRPTLTVTFTSDPLPPLLVRMPYLQRATPTSITIAWRTRLPADARVRYGPAPDDLSNQVIDPAAATDHRVTLSGLSPGTLYYYDVGTTAGPLAGGDLDHYFITPPDADGAQPFTVWVLGDSGYGTSPQFAVRDAMLAYTAGAAPDLMIHVGDIAYDDGTDEQFTERFFVPYETILRRTVCWPAFGNHDAGAGSATAEIGPYFEAFVLPRGAEAGGLASGTEAYYAFDYANVHFVCLDSQESDRAPGSPMLSWLAADLAATDQPWIMAFWHHPPYTKGSHDSDDPQDSGGRMMQMRENVLPILEQGGVDLVLAGHSHTYERSYLVDGAYDTPTSAEGHILDAGDGRPSGDGPYLKPHGVHPHEGAVYVVSGHGGAPVSGRGGHPLMFFTEVAHGSCLLTVCGNSVCLRNLRSDGVVSDDFELLKFVPGDLDNDGDTDDADRAAFVAVLLGLDATPLHVRAADLNADGSSDAADIGPFLALLYTVP